MPFNFLKNHFQNKTYFKFETLTFVPFDRNLIDECVLTNSQVGNGILLAVNSYLGLEN